MTEASVIVEDQPLGTISRRLSLAGLMSRALLMHGPHMGSETWQVEVTSDMAGLFGGPSLSATASSRPGRVAVTTINRQYSRSVTVNILAPGTVKSSYVLTAKSPDASNDAVNPDRVSPRQLVVDGSRAGRIVTTLPPHSMATIEFAINGAGRD